MRLMMCALAFLVSIALPAENGVAAEREMTVRQGPETVFDVPVGDIFPALSGATATGDNGRVGNEFVFWGYRLTDGGEVWFYACALVAGVDCNERRRAVCDGAGDVLAERADMGRAVDRRCSGIAIVGAGDLRPGCTDVAVESPLAVGLLACR